MAASAWAESLQKQIITATIPGVGAVTNVLHKLVDGPGVPAAPNMVVVISASVAIADIVVGAATAAHVVLTNNNAAAQTVVLLLERYHTIEGDVGATTSDYTATPVTHSHSYGLDNFQLKYKKD